VVVVHQSDLISSIRDVILDVHFFVFGIWILNRVIMKYFHKTSVSLPIILRFLNHNKGCSRVRLIQLDQNAIWGSTDLPRFGMQKILATIKTKEKNQEFGFRSLPVPVHRSLLSSLKNWNNWDTLKVLQFHNESIGGLYRHEIFEPNEKSLRPAFTLTFTTRVLIGRWREFKFESLSSRHKAPGWWRDAKLGIFIHWGLYSVPGFAPTRYMFRPGF